MTPKNYIQIDMGEIDNACFVIMPFNSLFQTQYERVIRPAVEELGLKCIRGDEIYSKPQIMLDIWKSIRRARIIIAELTDRNPNVFYEIGLAHALAKPIILLTRNEEDVPFDLKALRYRYYDVNDPYWGENLRKAIQSMIQNVLDEAEFAAYLDDISPSLQLPPRPQRLKVKTESTPILDITGNWRAKWKRDKGKISHQGVVFITQQRENLSATMTITFEKAGKMTIVQEILIGSIRGSQVSLNGTSYTYIEQGASTSYLLDNFSLVLGPDEKEMTGEFYSSRGKGTATLIKLEGNESK
jgi:hypothetical protein